MFISNLFKPYNDAFYSGRHDRSFYAATTVLSLLKRFYPNKNFSSILDVGCGTGTWLDASRSIGATDLYGIEGDWLPDSHFSRHATLLRKNLDESFSFSRVFDMSISLEVAEHINPSSAFTFIASLASTSNLILFSAAPPGQGGQHHVNEQPIAYWVDLFAQHNFYPRDFIREAIWNDPNIDFWYKQNILIFERNSSLSSNSQPLSFIHPDLFRIYSQPNSFLALKLFLRSIYPTFTKALRLFLHG